ncbi:pilus assembly protein [Streptomyces sp. ISL-98]|uniref:TadE family protein n=1 Tax=Streptomyces sp. ISL-98 TaxID=2819192 RepID=UPI001BE5892B|nr:TadE family protein [Streptomyces sp. ISL-98]MBT2506095.1 pilus assembly protein [Streptomyces sp. ISL-98]
MATTIATRATARVRTAVRSTKEQRDRGVSTLEFAGFLPVLLFVAMATIQLGIIGYAGSQAGTAARAAARTEAQEELRGQGEATGLAAISDWLADGASIPTVNNGDTVTATASIKIPSVIPGFNGFKDARHEVTMPAE